MIINYSQFTPWASLIGGLLIGVSATVFILGLGRIAGIAGIVAGALQGVARGSTRGQSATLLFLVGLIAAPWLWTLFSPLPPMRSVAGPGMLIFAGLLVGFGVRMGNGCTSGHGVCGLSRLSRRSLVNVITFVGAGVVTVVALRMLS
jgi:uncharacterized membrane protein YedE/YeeE